MAEGGKFHGDPQRKTSKAVSVFSKERDFSHRASLRSGNPLKTSLCGNQTEFAVGPMHTYIKKSLIRFQNLTYPLPVQQHKHFEQKQQKPPIGTHLRQGKYD